MDMTAFLEPPNPYKEGEPTRILVWAETLSLKEALGKIHFNPALEGSVSPCVLGGKGCIPDSREPVQEQP